MDQIEIFHINNWHVVESYFDTWHFF